MSKHKTKFAPFSPEEVERIKLWQKSGLVHKLMCKCESKTPLDISQMGLYCTDCGQTQNWVPAMMLTDYVKQTLLRFEELMEKKPSAAHAVLEVLRDESPNAESP